MNWHVILSMVRNIDKNSISFPDIDSWPRKPPVDGNNGFRMAQSTHILHLYLSKQNELCHEIKYYTSPSFSYISQPWLYLTDISKPSITYIKLVFLYGSFCWRSEWTKKQAKENNSQPAKYLIPAAGASHFLWLTATSTVMYVFMWWCILEPKIWNIYMNSSIS